MYGGHITDDWDRKLCRTYLQEFLNPQLVASFLSKILIWLSTKITIFNFSAGR